MTDTASEQWRLECEARHVVSMSGKQARRDYLDVVDKRRGTAAKNELEAAVRLEWGKRKGMK